MTGGASGIGAATIDALTASGHTCVAWDLAGDDDAAARDIVRCDVTDPSSVRTAMETTRQSRGLPTVLVTAAGVGSFAPVLDADPDEFVRVMRVNALGTLVCLQTFARALRDGGQRGTAVLVSSIDGHVPDRGLAVYAMSKSAVEMLTRVAAAELGPLGIRVNCVAPGVTDTAMTVGALSSPKFVSQITARTPLGRIGRADDVAAAVIALLDAEWVTGQVLTVDGGLTLHAPVDPYGVFLEG